jgi:hypothetical protein
MDPKSEMPSIRLIPSVDGYIDDTPYTDFVSPILWINPSPPPVAVPIMRFDEGDFSKNAVSVELYLWVTTAPSPATDIHAHAILKDWDPATTDWSMVTNGTFFDSTASYTICIPDMKRVGTSIVICEGS